MHIPSDTLLNANSTNIVTQQTKLLAQPVSESQGCQHDLLQLYKEPECSGGVGIAVWGGRIQVRKIAGKLQEIAGKLGYCKPPYLTLKVQQFWTGGSDLFFRSCQRSTGSTITGGAPHQGIVPSSATGTCCNTLPQHPHNQPHVSSRDQTQQLPQTLAQGKLREIAKKCEIADICEKLRTSIPRPLLNDVV